MASRFDGKALNPGIKYSRKIRDLQYVRVFDQTARGRREVCVVIKQNSCHGLR